MNSKLIWRDLINHKLQPASLIQIGLSINLLILLAYCAWTLNRGFDITDESYYLLLSIYPDAVKAIVSAQHWVTSVLWSATGSLIGFRAIGLGILLICALVLALGAIHASQACGITFVTRYRERSAIIVTTVSAALLYGSAINFSPCYNLIASSAGYAAMGLVLLASSKFLSWRAMALYLTVGFALGISFLCKATAGFATLLVVLILATVFGRSLRDRVAGVSLIIMGMGSTILLIALCHGTLAEALNQYRLGMLLFRQVQVEPVGTRLIRYVTEFFYHMVSTGKLFVVPFVSFLLYAKLRSIPVAIVGFAVLGYTLIAKGYLRGGVPFHIESQATSIVALLTMTLIVGVPLWCRGWKIAVLLAGLFILPYCIAVGTGNKLHTQIIGSLASWGTLIAILSFAEDLKLKSRNAAMLICAIFSFTITAQVVSNGFPAPYHLTSSICDQKFPIVIGDLGTVKVDQETHEFIAAIYEAGQRCDIQPTRPIWGFYNIPGIALPLRARPFLSPWINNLEQAETMLNIISSRNAVLHSAVVAVVLNHDGTLPKLPAEMASFPDGYSLCGTSTFPFQKMRIQIWVPKT